MRSRVWMFGAVLAAAVMLLAAGPAMAQGMMHGKGMGMMGTGTYLNLTADQQKQIRGIHREHMAGMMSLRAQVRDLNVAIDNELAQDKPKMSKVEKLREERTDVFAKLQEKMDEKRQAVRNVLTDEQKEKVGPCGMGACGMMGGGMGMMGGGMMNCPMMGGQQADDADGDHDEHH